MEKLEPAYILHTRAYRDSSLLVDFFCKNIGRMTAVARGVRSSKSKVKGLMQPFGQVVISWYGKNELVTLKTIEAAAPMQFYIGNKLISALYMNELLTRLLERYDPHPNLFSVYQQALVELNHHTNSEAVLRYFELQLLNEIGYGIHLTMTHDQQDISAKEHYYYFPERGLVHAQSIQLASNYDIKPFLGGHLLAIANNEFIDDSILHTAKRLLRAVLNTILTHKPIKSRELFLRNKN